MGELQAGHYKDSNSYNSAKQGAYYDGCQSPFVAHEGPYQK